MKEVKVYECPRCGGSGEIISDWDALNQLGMPVGFSEEAARRQRYYARRAYDRCGKCNGKGVVYKEIKD